ncbi:MAG: hypothetical protein HY321_08190 [Armatimonadetes bacterium]|nr:hypothetical protein [Armatimonadota bacterium]
MRYPGWFAALLSLSIATGAAAQRALPRVVVNGRVVPAAGARIVAGRTLLPLRTTAEVAGGQVAWDPQARRATILRGDDRVVVTVGRSRILVNERPVPIDVPPQIIEGRMMVPARAVAEGLGASVAWEPGTRTVRVQIPEAAVAGFRGGLAARLALSLRTSRETYRAGAPVEITLQVRNRSDRPLQLQFSSGRQHDFVALRDGREVWRWSHDRVFTQALTRLPLQPGETRTFTATWDQRDNAGNPVALGSYTVVGILPHTGEEALRASREIRIVAE